MLLVEGAVFIKCFIVGKLFMNDKLCEAIGKFYERRSMFVKMGGVPSSKSVKPSYIYEGRIILTQSKFVFFLFSDFILHRWTLVY